MTVARDFAAIDCSEQGNLGDSRALSFGVQLLPEIAQALGRPCCGRRPTGFAEFLAHATRRRGPQCTTAVWRARPSSSPRWVTSPPTSWQSASTVGGVQVLHRRTPIHWKDCPGNEADVEVARLARLLSIAMPLRALACAPCRAREMLLQQSDSIYEDTAMPSSRHTHNGCPSRSQNRDTVLQRIVRLGEGTNASETCGKAKYISGSNSGSAARCSYPVHDVQQQRWCQPGHIPGYVRTR